MLLRPQVFPGLASGCRSGGRPLQRRAQDRESVAPLERREHRFAVALRARRALSRSSLLLLRNVLS